MTKAFTMIEFMIIIALISLLSAVLILANKGEEKKMALQRAALKLVQDIREVQEMTMGAREADCGGFLTFSFGLYFHPTAYPESYLVFADCNENQHKDSSDVILKEIKLEQGLEIYRLDPSPLDIVFLPPEPATYINKSSWDAEALITLALESGPDQADNQKTVKINSVGRIEIE